MPEQKSVLTASAIKSLLSASYGLSIVKVSPFEHGSANCYCVADDHAMYFLKEYQSRFTEADLNCETALVDYLIKQNYPTAAIIPTLQGRLYLKYQGRLILLQKYICGKTYIKQRLPQHLLMESAGLLGKMHSLLHDYMLPCEMDAQWLKSFCPDQLAEEYDKLLEVLEAQGNDKFYERIKQDIQYKKHLAYEMPHFNRYYDGITYCATHGDYSCFQYICDHEHIIAVIDFSSAKTLPVVWEIMRSYVQSSDSCKDGKEFNVHDFCSYVRTYLRYAPLNKQDLAAMPYVYLNQLIRSKYGYKEYLITKTENREELIRFAFWRTDICREIFRKKEALSVQLYSLL